MTLVHGVELELERDRIALFVHERRGDFEPETIPAFLEAIGRRPGTTVLDVGAYTGLFTILAAKAGAPEVLAFEPNPSAHARALSNIVRNLGPTAEREQRVKLYNAAVSAFPGVGVMQIGDERLAISSTSKLLAAVPGGSTEIRTIDRLAPRHPIGVIKVDVEGHELSVFAGAIRVLDSYHPTVIAEVNSGSGGDRTEIVADFLASFGYVGRPADGRNMIFEVPDASHNDRGGAPR